MKSVKCRLAVNRGKASGSRPDPKRWAGVLLVALLLGVGVGYAQALEALFRVNRVVYRPAIQGPVTYVMRSPEHGNAGVWIYNSAGEIVANPYVGILAADEPVTVTWDGTGSQGQPVATGLYLAYLRIPFERRILKLILIR